MTFPQSAALSFPAGAPPEHGAGAVETVTFGCRLNSTESEAMRTMAQAAGLSDAVIVNTCAVTGEAVRQARQSIRRIRRERPGARILVTGCAAQIDPAMFAAMPEVDQVLGNGWKERPDAWRGLAGTDGRAPETRVLVDDIMAARTTAGHLIDGLENRVRGTVQVQTGCDHRCTFCVIPYGRGNSRSVPAGDVVAAVRRMVEAGVPEVVLTGVDLTSWGADLPGSPRLGDLVQRVLRLVPELGRLRLSSIDAIEIDPLLEELVTGEARVMPHLHLSLQHGDDLILKRMKRRHSRAQALDLISRLRVRRPGIAFGADLIAGFPTETDAAFEATLSLIEDADLAFVHAFSFSPRPGTPAARMPQLPPALIKARAAHLRAAAAAALGRHLEAHVGTLQEVLMERGGIGRLGGFTPVRVQGAPEPGAMQSVWITGHDGTHLLADAPASGAHDSVTGTPPPS